MYPHFVCPNCRTVADLEAELDDPFANGDWEDAPVDTAEETAPNEETTATAPVTTEARQIQEDVLANTASTEQIDQQHSSDVEPISDVDSHQTGENRRTPSSGSDSPPVPETSNSTVPAVDIVPRTSISDAQAGFSLLPRPSRTETPSPNGIASLAEGMPEGPMTPRNDFGPFVFDGSAGRARLAADATTADVSADEGEDAAKRPRVDATTAA